ncbi:hypothetical protein L1887_33885 [Cichorium endivia]|nr:hypothetical protein L1887_33885 [Cichorium endivia]
MSGNSWIEEIERNLKCNAHAIAFVFEFEGTDEVHEVDIEADSREDTFPENTCTDLFLTELCTRTIQSQVEEERESQSEDDKVSLNEELEDLEGD